MTKMPLRRRVNYGRDEKLIDSRLHFEEFGGEDKEMGNVFVMFRRNTGNVEYERHKDRQVAMWTEKSRSYERG